MESVFTMSQGTALKFFPLREVPILKRDAIDEKRYSFQWSLIDAGT